MFEQKATNDQILRALKLHNGNKGKTAKEVGLSRTQVINRLKQLGWKPVVDEGLLNLYKDVVL